MSIYENNQNSPVRALAVSKIRKTVSSPILNLPFIVYSEFCSKTNIVGTGKNRLNWAVRTNTKD